jgi:Tfp pilus assembly protein PilO
VSGRRAPLIAGAIALAVCVLAIVVFVLPKLGDVSAARTQLETVKQQQQVLEGRVAALEGAKQQQAQAEETIRQVDQAIPETADPQGALLLLNNAAIGSAVDIKTIAPGVPTFDAATGLSRMDFVVSVNGTFFALDDFLSKIETLPRAAKVTNLTLAPAGAEGQTSTPNLTMDATISLYTQDASAGPGSSPGPNSPAEAGAATGTPGT